MSAYRPAALAALAAFAAIGIGVALGLSTESGFSASLNADSENLTAYRTCVVTATPSSTSTVIDSKVQQANATTNYGTLTTFDVSSRSSQNRRTYIKFDLGGCTPSISASDTIRLATLRIYVSTLPAACRTVDIFRVTSSWTEAGLTWNNQPFGTTINNPASGSRTDSFNVGTPVGCENRVAGYVSGADVTSDVAAFAAGSATNHGWMLRDDVENSGTTRTSTYSAKNLGTLAQAPQLIVTYVTVP